VGMAVGVVAALALMRLLRSLLFEVQTTDATTFALVLATLSSWHCWLATSRRDAQPKVDPLVALRYE